MKNFFALALLCVTTLSQAALIKNSRTDSVSPARVVNVIKLVDKYDIKVNVLVEDHGGSTDMSPTQTAYFTLYAKGEMFSTDATFNLGRVFSVEEAKRISSGVYQIKITNAEYKQVVLTVDAAAAIVAIKNLDCGGDSDCEASKNFKATINVK